MRKLIKIKSSLLLKRIIYTAAVALAILFVFLKISGIFEEPLSVAVFNHTLILNNGRSGDPVLKNEIVSGSFQAKLNNLGIVAMRFDYKNEIDDELTFKLRERGHEKWYYESTYSAKLIPRGELFPFGFTPIADSKGKEYDFELSSARGTPENSLSISVEKPQLTSKYQFTPSSLLKSGQFFGFIAIKLFGGVSFSSIGATFLFATIILIILFFEREFNLGKYFKNRRFQIALIIIISFLTAFYLVGDNLKASFGVIDDHWIMYFLGTDKKASFTELPQLTLTTEVGQFGHYERFRPAYYPILITESILWGDNPFLWYLSRLFLFTASIAITWYILSRFYGLFISYLAVLFVLTYAFWADIWTRLIPGEIFAVFGTSLFALGYFQLIKWKSKSNAQVRQRISMIILTLGFIIAAGSKENLLILTVPLVYVFYKNKNLRKDFVTLSLAGLCFIYTSIIASAIFLSLARSGQDVYARDVSAGSRLDLVGPAVAQFIERFRIFYASLGTILLGFFVFATRSKEKITKYLLLAQDYFIALILSGVFFVTQYLFYSGQWPQNNRYDFPGMLIGPFLIFFTAVIYFRMISFFFKIPMNAKTIRRIVIFVLTLMIAFSGFETIQERSKTNQMQTNEFSKKLNILIKELKSNPDLPVVIESYSVRDYEPIFSLQRYFRASNLTNPMYLRLHGYKENTGANLLEQRLSTELSSYSQKGNDKDFSFSPLSELSDNVRCISIVLSTRIKGPEFCSITKYL